VSARKIERALHGPIGRRPLDEELLIVFHVSASTFARDQSNAQTAVAAPRRRFMLDNCAHPAPRSAAWAAATAWGYSRCPSPRRHSCPVDLPILAVVFIGRLGNPQLEDDLDRLVVISAPFLDRPIQLWSSSHPRQSKDSTARRKDDPHRKAGRPHAPVMLLQKTGLDQANALGIGSARAIKSRGIVIGSYFFV